MSPSHTPHLSFPSSSYSHPSSAPTLSSHTSSPSQYASQILTLNHSLCKDLYDQYRARLLHDATDLRQSHVQYLFCLLNFKGRKMNYFLRDFENSVAHKFVSKEFTRVQTEFSELYWKGYGELVNGIIRKRADFDRKKETQAENRNSGGSDSRFAWNSTRTCCDEDLAKYSDCLMRNVTNGDSCEPLKTNFRLCKQINATIDNGALGQCTREAFIRWHRSQHPMDTSQMDDDAVYSRIDDTSAQLCMLNCVDLFLYGFQEQLQTEAEIQGRITFIEEEQDIDF